MKTTKKTTKTKTAPPPPVPTVSDPLVMAHSVCESLLSPTPPVELPQSVLRVIYDLDALSKEIEKAQKAFAAYCASRREQGNPIEPGEFALKVNETTRRTPAWKKVAVDEAKTVADLRGEIFDADLYAQRVLANTQPTTSVSYSVVKGGVK